MKTIHTILGWVFLICFGCAGTRLTPVQTPDGRVGYIAECEAVSDCYRYMTEYCSAGYYIIEQSQRQYTGTTAFQFKALKTESSFLFGCKSPGEKTYSPASAEGR